MTGEQDRAPSTDGSHSSGTQAPPAYSSRAPGDSSNSVWDRIKRHKVVEWTLAYVAFAYAVLHGVQMLREMFEWSLLVPRLTFVALLVGAPIAGTVAWYHGHRAQHRVGGRELSILIALLAVAGSALWWTARTNQEKAHTTAVAAASAAPQAAFNPPEHSIAVLPFVDLSEKHDQEYFADGMAEEILNLLAKVPDLKVIGRTSSFQFKGKADDLRKIGATLGTAYVVEGSVRRSGDHIRVTAQLIDTRNGTHRWSEAYDREASDTLKLQDEIAASLVRELQLEVASSNFLEGRVFPKTSEAYDTYLRGLHAFNRFDQQGFDEAAANFRHTLQIDPQFVPAAEQLARALCDLPSWGLVAPSIGYEQARAAASATLKLDPNSALGHTILGCVHLWYDWDWEAAHADLKTAMALDPYNPVVLVFAAEERIAVGQWIEALRLLETAISADPLLATLYENSKDAYVRLGRYPEAERAMRRALEISPTFIGGYYELGVVLLMEGRSQEALVEMQKEVLLGKRSAGLVLAYHALHRSHDADVELTGLKAEHSADMAVYIAEAHAFRGQKDEAFKWLDRAYAQKDISLLEIKGDPLLKNLENDPRYKAFLRKMNLPE